MSDLRPWEKTIEEYLDESMVGSSIGPIVDPAHMAEAAGEPARAHVRTSPRLPEYVFHFNSSTDFKIVHSHTGETAGAWVGSFAYVDPRHRGRGLTSEMYVMIDEAGIRRDRWNLTPMSLSARRGAPDSRSGSAQKRGQGAAARDEPVRSRPGGRHTAAQALRPG